MMRSKDQVFFEQISALMGNAVLQCSFVKEEMSYVMEKDLFLRALTLLRDHGSCLFNQLMDVTVVDYLKEKKEFHVVYHLLSMEHNKRIRLKIHVGEGEVMPSITSIFPAANWYEREAWDMYGVVFEGHPDMRRILTDYEFEGHPLRKDFPLWGHTEVSFDEASRKVVSSPVHLTQEYREFDFQSPWEGMMDVAVRHNGEESKHSNPPKKREGT